MHEMVCINSVSQKKVFLRGIAIKYGDGINKYLPKYVINCPQNNR